MIRYYCSGYDINNAFGHGLGDMLKKELKGTRSLVLIPGGEDKIEKVKSKYLPIFVEHFKNVGINFDEVSLITTDMEQEIAIEKVASADFILLMGGDPFKQKDICEKLGLIDTLKNYNGIMMGFSAGAMLMSKYIIITPCSEEYPDFHIEEGLNFDELSIYPHNNTTSEDYPEILYVNDEEYKRDDLISVANDYGNFYLLQDNCRENGITDVSLIKSTDGKIEFYTENDGKIWEVDKNGVKLLRLKK